MPARTCGMAVARKGGREWTGSIARRDTRMTEGGTALPARSEVYRVLIVDDNEDAADSLAMLARVWGHEVQAVYDGETALATAIVFRPDCLLLDIGLPRLDGYALARRIRQEPGLESAKLVAVSAYSSEEHAQRVK